MKIRKGSIVQLKNRKGKLWSNKMNSYCGKIITIEEIMPGGYFKSDGWVFQIRDILKVIF